MNPEEEVASDANIEGAVASLMKSLPKPVQDFLVSDERGRIARELSTKHNLHADQAGEFEQAYLHMLLGISSPEDFVSALKKAGLPQETINGLAADVNARVFIPLREAERNPVKKPNEVVAQMPVPPPPPRIDYQPTTAPQTLPGSSVTAPMPESSPVVSFTPPVSVPPAPTAVSQQHVVHSAPSNNPQQGWHPAAAVHIFVPTHGGHIEPQAPVMPSDESIQASLVAPRSVAAPQVQTISQDQPRIPSEPVPYINPEPATSAPSTPIQKEYAADPYREPI